MPKNKRDIFINYQLDSDDDMAQKQNWYFGTVGYKVLFPDSFAAPLPS